MKLTLLKRAFLIFSVLFTCVGCDQVTKSIARNNLPRSETISLLNDFFRLQYAENPGAFLSLGASAAQDLRYWVFIILIGFVLAGMLVFVLTSRRISMVEIVAFSLVLAGGIGNLIDRVFHEGRVLDFMNMGIGSLRTGIFNVADIAIMIGCLWFFFYSVWGSRKGLIKL